MSPDSLRQRYSCCSARRTPTGRTRCSWEAAPHPRRTQDRDPARARRYRPLHTYRVSFSSLLVTQDHVDCSDSLGILLLSRACSTSSQALGDVRRLRSCRRAFRPEWTTWPLVSGLKPLLHSDRYAQHRASQDFERALEWSPGMRGADIEVSAKTRFESCGWNLASGCPCKRSPSRSIRRCSGRCAAKAAHPGHWTLRSGNRAAATAVAQPGPR
jgi:hypothetical protein